ncbi:MAG: tyrosine recombinase [Anaerolineales bacterium]|nr:tyrosine recombinase [Anaerolineales bacterium]
MEKELLAFLDYLEQEYHYSQNTIAAYRNDLSQFSGFLQSGKYNGLQNWSAVNEEMINDYVDFMKNREKPLASSSIARKVAAVKSFFNFLFARGFIEENPSAHIDSPKVKKRLPQTLSAKDVENLLAAPTKKSSPKHLRDTALLQILYATGMRVTEVVSLRLDDVDKENQLLNSPGATGDVRQIPLDDETTAILEKYLADGRPYLAKSRNEQALFLNHRGKQLTRQGLWLIIKAYAKEADLNAGVTPHTLRHSFAAHKLTEGSDLEEVQKLLGHANISTTQIYAQVNKPQKVKA